VLGFSGMADVDDPDVPGSGIAAGHPKARRARHGRHQLQITIYSAWLAHRYAPAAAELGTLVGRVASGWCGGHPNFFFRPLNTSLEISRSQTNSERARGPPIQEAWVLHGGERSRVNTHT